MLSPEEQAVRAARTEKRAARSPEEKEAVAAARREKYGGNPFRTLGHSLADCQTLPVRRGDVG